MQNDNKNKLVKIGVAGVVASCIAAGAIFAIESPDNTSQFQSKNLSQSDAEFMSHVTKFKLNYKTKAQYKQAQKNWQKADDFIKAHNADPTQTATVGHNMRSTMSEEMKNATKGYTGATNDVSVWSGDVAGAPPANGVDWVEKNMVTPIQQQGDCGSCWTFSASGAISSRLAIKNNVTPVDYSEQQILDCYESSTYGCNGGTMNSAFGWITTHPLELSSNYPYVNGDSKTTVGTCTFNAAEAGNGVITGYTQVKAEQSSAGVWNTANIKTALMAGPVSVGVDASSNLFSYYTGGIIGAGCGTSLDHGILAVGYGTSPAADGGNEYILVKNQWGNTWGTSGFGMIDINNSCGILSAASFPTV